MILVEVCYWADRLSPPQVADTSIALNEDVQLSQTSEAVDTGGSKKKKSCRQRAAAAGVCETAAKPHNTAEAQLNEYLQMEVDSEEEINPVRFWKKHSKQMPALSKLALYVLGVPAT